METTSLLKSRTFRAVMVTLVAVVFILCIFRLGVFVGERKAMFTYRWGDNYHQNFGGPRRGLFGDFEGRGFMDAHGAFGTVMKVDGNTLVVKDKDNTEKTVLVGKDTSIRKLDQTIPLTEVSSTDRVVIIGSPNDQGQIDAKFIRVFPEGTMPSPPPGPPMMR